MFDGSSTGAFCVWILRHSAPGRRQRRVLRPLTRRTSQPLTRMKHSMSSEQQRHLKGMSDSFQYSHDCDLMDRTACCLAVFSVYFMSLASTSTQWLKYLGSLFRFTCGGLAFILVVLNLLVKAIAAQILGTTVFCWVDTLETNGLCCLNGEL